MDIINFYQHAERRANVTSIGGKAFSPEDKREIVRRMDAQRIKPHWLATQIAGCSHGTDYSRHMMRLRTFIQQVEKERSRKGVVVQAPSAPRHTIMVDRATVTAHIQKNRAQIESLQADIAKLEVLQDILETSPHLFKN